MKLYRMLLPLAMMTAAFAQPGPAPAQTFDNIKTYLGLSDATVQSIEQAIQKSQSTIQGLATQLAAKQKVVADLLSAGSTDANAVGKAVLDVESVRKQIRTQHDAVQSTVVSYLTAAQKTKLTALEDAAKLQPTIHEAAALHLITPPAGNGFMGGPGMGGCGLGMGPGRGMGPGMGMGRGMGLGMGLGSGPMGSGFMRRGGVR